MGTIDVRTTRTVLLVEDNPGDASLVRDALGHDGLRCELRWVQRLEEGLMSADGAEVVLLDLGLPDSDGIETLRRWRHRAPDVPVVVDDVRTRLFEPFTRSAATAAKPGTGLGLAIVSRLTERLGGSVAYAPDSGRTRFVVTLPRLAVTA